MVDEEFAAHQLIDKVLLHQQSSRIMSEDIDFFDRLRMMLTYLAVLELRVKSYSDIVTSLIIEVLRW